MKKLRSISLAILLALGVSIVMLTPWPALAQSNTNLAPNPSFEYGTDSPTGWEPLPGNSGGNLCWDETVAHTGDRSVSISNVTNDAWTAMWRTADFIPVNGLEGPDFSVWVKMAGTKGRENVLMQLMFYNADGGRLGGFGKLLPFYYESWTQVYFRADDPNGWNDHLPLVQASTYLRLQFSVVDYNPGASALTVWFDDVYFGEPIPPNEPPAVDAGVDQTMNEGDAVNLSPATFTDPDTDDTHTATIDWGDTSPIEAGAVSESGGSGTVSGYHVYEDNGTYTVTVCVIDDDGAEACDTLTAIVNNVAPIVDAGPDDTINEGGTFSSSGSFTDPGADTWNAAVNYGDEPGIQPLTLNPDNTFDLSHIYDDNGGYTVTVTVTDDDGGVGIDTVLVTVNNVAPIVAPITAPIDPVAVGAPITASAPFTDPGTLDTHTAEWDWGDGITPGTMEQGAGFGTVTDDHTYSVPGVYTITLTVTDDDGGVGTAVYRYVVVYDPEGGFVTGGGWIDSSAGAYSADLSLSGKANFGFVSKYKKGATTPTGNTEFQFKAGDLNFHSSSYDWLVIAGHRAMYKGTGTINGEGNYGFMLCAIDEKLTPSTDVDMFRIKIWDKDNGDVIIYDNQMGDSDDADPVTAIQGGNIVIHK